MIIAGRDPRRSVLFLSGTLDIEALFYHAVHMHHGLLVGLPFSTAHLFAVSNIAAPERFLLTSTHDPFTGLLIISRHS